MIELLDELKPIQDAWVPHRFNIVNAKISARECMERMILGMILAAGCKTKENLFSCRRSL